MDNSRPKKKKKNLDSAYARSLEERVDQRTSFEISIDTMLPRNMHNEALFNKNTKNRLKDELGRKV